VLDVIDALVLDALVLRVGLRACRQGAGDEEGGGAPHVNPLS
jgi:hypothetical protein